MATFKVVRFFFRDDEETLVIKTGLTEEEAMEHCQNPETSSSTATSPEAMEYTAKHGPWFDGFTDEVAR